MTTDFKIDQSLQLFNKNSPRSPSKLRNHVVSPSTSLALNELHDVFSSIDIDDEGLLDEASFATALMQLGISLPYSELEKTFNELDVDNSGLIKYDEVLRYIKMGKIKNSTLISKVKKPNSTLQPKPITHTKKSFGHNPNILLGVPPSLPINTPEPTKHDDRMDRVANGLDKCRLELVQRAILVIKRSILTKIPREEVKLFLEAKRMTSDEIDLAFFRAQESATSCEDKLHYEKELSREKDKQISTLETLNSNLSQKIQELTIELEEVRSVLSTAANVIERQGLTKADAKEDIMTKSCAKELTKVMQNSKKQVEKAVELKNEAAIEVFKADLTNTTNVSKALLEKKYYNAWLYVNTLSSSNQNAMPSLLFFLRKYKIPRENVRLAKPESDSNSDTA